MEGNIIIENKTTWKKKALITMCLFLAVALGIVANVQIHIGNDASQYQRALTVGNVLTLTIGPEDALAATSPDYTCDGTADDVQFQAALNALPANGGKILVLGGQYNFTSTVTRAIDNVIIEGVGYSSYFVYNGASAIFLIGGDNWVFQDIRCDAGFVDKGSGADWQVIRCWDGATLHAADTASGADHFSIPTGRGATFVVAANDASDASKAQADYVCDGIADDVQIQAAIDALPSGGGKVLLSEGYFYIASTVNVGTSVYLNGSGDATVITGAAGLSTAVFKIPDYTVGASICNMYIDVNHIAGVSGIYVEETTNAPRYLTLENLRIVNADNSTACYGILIDGLFTSSFKNIYIWGCANGLRWNDVDGAGTGNSSIDQLYITINTSNGIGLDIERSSHFSIRRFQVNGDGVATGQTGVRLYGAHQCHFAETDIELVKYPIVVSGSGPTGTDASQDNTFDTGYLHSNANNGIGINVGANALRTAFYDMTVDGTSGGTSIGILDDADVTNNGSTYINIAVNTFDTITSFTGKPPLGINNIGFSADITVADISIADNSYIQTGNSNSDKFDIYARDNDLGGRVDIASVVSANVPYFSFGGNGEVKYYESGTMSITEQVAGGSPAANTCWLMAQDNGGKTELYAVFPSGPIQQIAIEP